MILLLVTYWAALAVVLPMTYHPREDGQMIDFLNMKEVDTRAKVQYLHKAKLDPSLKRNFHARSTHKRHKNVMPLSSLRHVEYSTQVVISNVTFNLLTDTGSSEMWVPSSKCPDTECYQHARYNASSEVLETSLKQLAPRETELPLLSIEYGSGKVGGTTVCDRVWLDWKTSMNHCFGQVSHSGLARFYSNTKMDGVLGLSFAQLKSTRGKLFMEDFVNQVPGMSFVFAFYFAPENRKHEESSSLFFLGEYNEQCAAEPISFHRVSKPFWWEVSADLTLRPPEVATSEKSTGFQKIIHNLFGDARKILHAHRFSKPMENIIFDSGTSMMCLPAELIAQLNRQMHALFQEHPLMRYSDLEGKLDAAISALSIKIDTKEYVLKGSDLTACTLSGERKMQCSLNAESATDCCSAAEPCIIAGMPFFRRHYVVFNMKNAHGVGAEIGLAKANHNAPDCLKSRNFIQPQVQSLNAAEADAAGLQLALTSPLTNQEKHVDDSDPQNFLRKGVGHEKREKYLTMKLVKNLAVDGSTPFEFSVRSRRRKSDGIKQRFAMEAITMNPGSA